MLTNRGAPRYLFLIVSLQSHYATLEVLLSAPWQRARERSTGDMWVCVCWCFLSLFHPLSLLLYFKGGRWWLEASLDLQHWDALLLWLFAAAAYELSLVTLNYRSPLLIPSLIFLADGRNTRTGSICWNHWWSPKNLLLYTHLSPALTTAASPELLQPPERTAKVKLTSSNRKINSWFIWKTLKKPAFYLFFTNFDFL